jgi:hypothetical protein
VMTAAFSSCHFQTVWGIELLPELLDAAESVRAMLTNLLKQTQVQGKDQALQTESKPESLHDLNHAIESIFQDLSVSTMAIEGLVDRLCKKIGHKEYKKMLKGCKSFKRFLSLFPLKYLVDGEEVTRVLPQEPDLGSEESHTSEQLDLDESLAQTLCPLPVTDPRRQTRPDAILTLLTTPVGKTLSNAGALPNIRFDCQDIFELNWWDEGDVVYCASLLFSEEMMILLLERVWWMKAGAYFISLKPFPSRSPTRQGDSIFELDEQSGGTGLGRKMTLVSDSFYRMSWQMARVYIYQLGPRVVPGSQSESEEREEKNISEEKLC